MSVIVFGPTGSVASFVARTAQEKGSKVFLAMRDTKKLIPGLSAEQEKHDNFERLQADLTDPASVSAAVKASGAKRAFTYLGHGTSDHMKDTLTALKSGGIEFVVFLSSYTVSGDLKAVPPSEVIPFIHAQVEISLDEIFGPENYVALRPGGFATNLLRYKKGIQNREVKLFAHDFKFDYITPRDMGRVGGTILVQGPRNGQRKVYLYGPKIIPQGDAIVAVGKILEKDVKITSLSAEEGVDQYIQSGVPKPLAEYMVRKSSSSTNDLADRACYNEGVENVKLYTGEPSMGLEDWVEANKSLFTA